MSAPDPAAGDWCQCGNPNRGGTHTAYRCGYDYRQTHAYATHTDTAAVGDVEAGARLVSHPTPGKVWVQFPHRNDIGNDWIEADATDVLDAARREGGAEALRGAADDIETALLDEMVPETVKQADVVHYLRRRAARYGGAN
jgi:hypothetical protein